MRIQLPCVYAGIYNWIQSGAKMKRTSAITSFWFNASASVVFLCGLRSFYLWHEGLLTSMGAAWRLAIVATLLWGLRIAQFRMLGSDGYILKRPTPPFRAANARRGGFTFVEVLFAVLLLGLGFIMIAGIFPVAMEQTTRTANETTGALVAQDAIREIQTVADKQNATFPLIIQQNSYGPIFPIAITVTPFSQNSPNDNTLTELSGSAYYPSDHRFGWVGFYRRPNITDPYAQVWVIVLQNPNFADPGYGLYNVPPPIPSGQTAYTAPPSAANVIPPAANSPIVAQTAYSPSTGNSYIFLNNPLVVSGDPVPNAVTGAFVLVAVDPGNPSAAPPYTRPANDLVGRFMRLGTANPQIPGDIVPPTTGSSGTTLPWDAFQLQPGNDLKDASEETIATSGSAVNLNTYIIGAAPDRNTGVFNGPNQDVTAVSSFIRINTAAN
jgi:type II secretory pathway pseudopilin PulG